MSAPYDLSGAISAWRQAWPQTEGEASAVDILPPSLTFEQWVDSLGERGLLVDGKPFRLDNRPALRFVYRQIPANRGEAHHFMMAIMKGAQTGLTVMEMLVAIWCMLKYSPCAVGSYVPDMTLAAYKSSERFMPILRRVPEAYSRLRDEAKLRSTGGREGNVLTRSIGSSRVQFLWTSGTITTESYPFDVLNFDEVQEMSHADIEKTQERLSASDIKMRLFLSTAKYPDADIDYLFKRGTRYRFHTACACPAGVILDEVFPECVVLNTGQYQGAPADEYVYRCPTCNSYIPDAQAPAAIGEDGWLAEVPDARYVSIHFPQTLSPTISAREIYEAFINAKDLENFYRRKLGRPFVDPSRIPVTLAMLELCAAEGVKRGLKWETQAKDTFMGIDQMGAYNVVIIKRRMPDGRQAVVHVEQIYDLDPFVRCDTLMADYGVQCCVLETLPNYNDAKRFSQRHKGKVFLASYQVIEDEMMRWGDAARMSRQERKISAEERDHYTVSLDQYKCMQVAMKRFALMQCLFPDPAGLIQEHRDGKVKRNVAVLREVVFHHFTKTALVTEAVNDEENRVRRQVVKIGIDPHFSYANMLCDVAWSRAFGTSTFIMPEGSAVRPETPEAKVIKALETAKQPLPVRIETLPAGYICGNCANFREKGNHCDFHNVIVRAQDPGCSFMVARKK